MIDARTLTELRKEIDRIDDALKALLMQRFDCAERIAVLKEKKRKESVELESEDNDISALIYRPEREREIFMRLLKGVPKEREEEYEAILRVVLHTSKQRQKKILEDIRRK